MALLDFVTQEELDDLDDDSRVAFMQFVNHAQRRLAEATRRRPQDEEDWAHLRELRHSFMNVVVAAAKRFEIEPFVSIEIPRIDAFGDTDHRQFSADLDHYFTQLALDNSIRAKRDSVELLPASKDRIRVYLLKLRECVEKSTLPDAKRERLLDTLNRFQEDLERRRTNILTVARVAIEVLAMPGALWASADVAHRLLTNVMQVVAEAKAAEQEMQRRLAPIPELKALSPPRTEQEGKAPSTRSRIQEIFEDDIPF